MTKNGKLQQRKSVLEVNNKLGVSATSDTDDEDASDNDEFIVHQEGYEEIHITRKAKRQLKMKVAHFKVIKHNHSSQHQNGISH